MDFFDDTDDFFMTPSTSNNEIGDSSTNLLEPFAPSTSLEFIGNNAISPPMETSISPNFDDPMSGTTIVYPSTDSPVIEFATTTISEERSNGNHERSTVDDHEFFEPNDLDQHHQNDRDYQPNQSTTQPPLAPRRLPNGRFMSKSQLDMYARGVTVAEIVRLAVEDEQRRKAAMDEAERNGQVYVDPNGTKKRKKKKLAPKPPSTSTGGESSKKAPSIGTKMKTKKPPEKRAQKNVANGTISNSIDAVVQQQAPAIQSVPPQSLSQPPQQSHSSNHQPLQIQQQQPPIVQTPPVQTPSSSSCIQIINGQPVIQARLERVQAADGTIMTVAVIPADIQNLLRASGLMMPGTSVANGQIIQQPQVVVHQQQMVVRQQQPQQLVHQQHSQQPVQAINVPQAMQQSRPHVSSSPNLIFVQQRQSPTAVNLDQRYTTIQPNVRAKPKAPIVQQIVAPSTSSASPSVMTVTAAPQNGQLPMERFTFRLSGDDERIVGELTSRIAKYQSMENRTAEETAMVAQLEQQRSVILQRAAENQFKALSNPTLVQSNEPVSNGIAQTSGGGQITISKPVSIPPARAKIKKEIIVDDPATIMEKCRERAKAKFRWDQEFVRQPDCTNPFVDQGDVFRRLLPYHLYDEPNVKEELLSTADSDFRSFMVRCKGRMQNLYDRFHTASDATAPFSSAMGNLIVSDLMLKDVRQSFAEEKEMADKYPDRYAKRIRKELNVQSKNDGTTSTAIGDSHLSIEEQHDQEPDDQSTSNPISIRIDADIDDDRPIESVGHHRKGDPEPSPILFERIASPDDDLSSPISLTSRSALSTISSFLATDSGADASMEIDRSSRTNERRSDASNKSTESSTLAVADPNLDESGESLEISPRMPEVTPVEHRDLVKSPLRITISRHGIRDESADGNIEESIEKDGGKLEQSQGKDVDKSLDDHLRPPPLILPRKRHRRREKSIGNHSKSPNGKMECSSDLGEATQGISSGFGEASSIKQEEPIETRLRSKITVGKASTEQPPPKPEIPREKPSTSEDQIEARISVKLVIRKRRAENVAISPSSPKIRSESPARKAVKTRDQSDEDESSTSLRVPPLKIKLKCSDSSNGGTGTNGKIGDHISERSIEVKSVESHDQIGRAIKLECVDGEDDGQKTNGWKKNGDGVRYLGLDSSDSEESDGSMIEHKSALKNGSTTDQLANEKNRLIVRKEATDRRQHRQQTDGGAKSMDGRLDQRLAISHTSIEHIKLSLKRTRTISDQFSSNQATVDCHRLTVNLGNVLSRGNVRSSVLDFGESSFGSSRSIEHSTHRSPDSDLGEEADEEANSATSTSPGDSSSRSDDDDARATAYEQEDLEAMTSTIGGGTLTTDGSAKIVGIPSTKSKGSAGAPSRNPATDESMNGSRNTANFESNGRKGVVESVRIDRHLSSRSSADQNGATSSSVQSSIGNQSAREAGIPRLKLFRASNFSTIAKSHNRLNICQVRSWKRRDELMRIEEANRGGGGTANMNSADNEASDDE